MVNIAISVPCTVIFVCWSLVLVLHQSNKDRFYNKGEKYANIIKKLA
jgi:hypothetical protein